MGRHFAGHGFLSAFARHASSERVIGYVRTPGIGQEFSALIQEFRADRETGIVTASTPEALRGIGCLYTPAPINASQVWLREFHGPRSWSLCGVNHTLASARVMDGLTSLLLAPVQPWDAIICTSAAARDVIGRLFARQAEHLSRRLGATRVVLPQLPVIPLGVDCAAQSERMRERDRVRAQLGLRSEDIVVLFVGRLSFHAKANPAPMYIALERLAARHRIVLVECGWTPNVHITQAFADAKGTLCPSVRGITLDGRQPEARIQAWAAADIFCSLSDNIQESFGLTPIEAMAAGLPVVVSDWDGYKDTVRNGMDGFAVPTVAAPPGFGRTLAARHAFEIDSYDLYVGQVSTAVVVDIDAATNALDQLASDPDLRRRMGANGAARAREIFDWKVIVRAYERLWDHLAELRQAKQEASPSSERSAGFWPARPDPFELFGSFPSSTLSQQHRVVPYSGIDEEAVRARIALKMTMAEMMEEVPAELLVEVWRRASEPSSTVKEFLDRQPNTPVAQTLRALLWLAKFGLLRISVPESEKGA
jgi:glycosyltransferase involved in cell wall biosynthesis